MMSYSLEQSREDESSLDNDVKKHVNHIATTWYTHGAHMNNTWILG